MSVLTASRRRAILAALGVLVIGTGSLLVVRAVMADSCTIDNVMTMYGVDLGPSAAFVSDGVSALIEEASTNRAPGAVVVATRVAKAASRDLPPVDGHRVLIRQMDHVPDGVIEGPAGLTRIAGEVKCAVAIYDADTGDFLVSLQRLEPRP